MGKTQWLQLPGWKSPNNEGYWRPSLFSICFISKTPKRWKRKEEIIPTGGRGIGSWEQIIFHLSFPIRFSFFSLYLGLRIWLRVEHRTVKSVSRSLKTELLEFQEFLWILNLVLPYICKYLSSKQRSRAAGFFFSTWNWILGINLF